MQLETTFRDPRSVTVPSILLVEDDLPVAGLTELSLRRRGFNVSVVHDAEAAWRLLQQSHLDLVVADFLLPGMNGVQLCRRMCQDTALAKVPVIVLTAYPSRVVLPPAVEQNVMLISKPFHPEKLACAIREMLTDSPVEGEPAQTSGWRR